MARTRSKPAPKATEPDTTTLPPPTKALSSVSNPPKLFVLPKDASPDARIVTLNNPATATPSRYLFCPDKGFYEFTRVAAPKKTPRSWLITSNQSDQDEKPQSTGMEKKNSGESKESDPECTSAPNAYITKSADLFLATPIDILFLLLPALSPKSLKSPQPQRFLSLEDHLDALTSSSPHLKHLIRDPRLKEMITNRMPAICDSVSAGPETMFRLSLPKLAEVLIIKAQRMTQNGLPASMEDKFITPALDIPIMSIKREETDLSLATEETIVSVSEDPDTQESSTAPESQTTTTSISTATTTTNISDPLTTPPSIPPLLRLRTTLNYILTSYIPLPLHTPLSTILSTLPPSLEPLDTHLSTIAKLRAEATALHSLSNNISRKRGYEDDEEKMAEREEKKRKKEEEEKKKKLVTRGVKQLKKVNTTGMKKLSAFFTKAPVVKKA